MDAQKRIESQVVIAEAEEALRVANGLDSTLWSSRLEALFKEAVVEPYYPLVQALPELLKFGRELERAFSEIDPRLLGDPENTELETEDFAAIKEIFKVLPSEVRQALTKGLAGGILLSEAMKIADCFQDSKVKTPSVIAAGLVLIGAVI